MIKPIKMDVLRDLGKYDKKALLVSVFLLIAIPFSVFLALQRQELRSYAQTSGWKIYNRNPIVFPGGGSEDNNIYAPDVHKEGSVWKMWYGGQGEDGHDRIHYAVSTDGINWQKKGVVLDNGKARHVNDPSVVLVNDTYYMYYTDYTDGIGDRIHLATSTDGINWQKKGVVVNVVPNSWESEHTARPSVIYENNQFKMWYDATGPTGRHVGYATSIDGISWTRRTGNPIKKFPNGHTFAVQSLKIGDKHYLYFYGGGSTTTPPNLRVVEDLGDGKTFAQDKILPLSSNAYPLFYDASTNSCWMAENVFSPGISSGPTSIKVYAGSDCFSNMGTLIGTVSSTHTGNVSNFGAAVKERDVNGQKISGNSVQLYFASGNQWGNWQPKSVILTAVGSSWVAKSANISFPAVPQFYSPNIIFENGIYKMWVTAGDRIRYYSSADGNTWSDGQTVFSAQAGSWEDDGNNFEGYQGGISDSKIIKNVTSGYTYTMYYTAGPDPNTDVRGGLGIAFSNDGINWQKYANNPVYLNAGAVDIKHIGNFYYMVYESREGTYWAESPDGLTWTGKGMLFGKGGGANDAYGHVTPMIYVENGVWTRVYFGGASHSCWCQNRIFMAQTLTLCTADQAADSNVADGIDKRYCTINEHPSGKIIKSGVETVNRSCSSPLSYWEASDCYNPSDDSILYGEKKVYIDDIKKYSIKLRVAIDDYLDWIEINGNRINQSSIAQKCCSDYNNWMVVTDKFATGWNVVKFKAVEGCGMDSWGGCGGRLVDLDFSVTTIISTPSPTPTPIPTPTVSGDCSGCTGGISCDEACRNAGYGSRGVCAVPGSTDPGRCCACFD